MHKENVDKSVGLNLYKCSYKNCTILGQNKTYAFLHTFVHIKRTIVATLSTFRLNVRKCAQNCAFDIEEETISDFGVHSKVKAN